jgi:hypothetical protein
MVTRISVKPERIDWSGWMKDYNMETIADQTVDAYSQCARGPRIND